MNALTVKGVDVSYGAARVLKKFSLSVETGKVTCLLGRNGVGKSTLLRTIVGQLRQTHGTVSLGERDISELKPFERARLGVAYVPQGREIFPLLTVKENLETGYAKLPPMQRKLPAEIFELFPVLSAMLGRRGGDLSGGQQQQLAIARALVTRPRLLLLDEPTEGIQPSIIKDIGRAISFLRHRGDMGILLVEQYYDFARVLADRICVIDRGEIVVSGSASDLGEAEIKRHLTV
ncbi:MAG: urea ABC transporter ATP-binding subunit UrtE [Rhizobiales bacterium]|nr:urea ABC transporter ATP-binding subunit UrtE [Hyphomicrobiales bacterium]